MGFPLLLAFFFFFSLTIASVSGDEAIIDFEDCATPFNCGTKTNLSYPFWAPGFRPRECGHPDFELLSCENIDQNPVLKASSLLLSLIAVNQTSRTLTVALTDYSDTVCPPINGTASLNTSLLAPSPSNSAALQNLTLFYGCRTSGAGKIPNTRLSCLTGVDLVSFYANETFLSESDVESCRGRVVFPIPADAPDGIWGRDAEAELQGVLDAGVNVSYGYGEYGVLCKRCGESDGLCGTAAAAWGSPRNFSCHCPAGGSRPVICPPPSMYSITISLHSLVLSTGSFIRFIVCPLMFCSNTNLSKKIVHFPFKNKIQGVSCDSLGEFHVDRVRERFRIYK
ncbi:unnamed protein product [Linum trigynum]|uniref:non-specific serine/threonine protein kinase n=1 Tax=Linum trigynum TaxID=586398 RepID=A0AAV2EYJ5_9ROSI